MADYAATWIGERPGLRPETVLIYTGLLRRHIAPHFDNVTVPEVTLPRVRRWRKKLLDSGSVRSLRLRRTGCCALSSTRQPMTD